MLVVSDTSPLNYLILIDAVEVLPRLYGRVIVPQAVADELVAAAAPYKTRLWFSHPPAWIEIHPVPTPRPYPTLDVGETQAINLAAALNADLLLVDERRATFIARQQEHLATTGTLGVLLDAALAKLIDLPTTLSTLEHQTTFRAPSLLYEQILQEYRRRTQD